VSVYVPVSIIHSHSLCVLVGSGLAQLLASLANTDAARSLSVALRAAQDAAVDATRPRPLAPARAFTRPAAATTTAAAASTPTPRPRPMTTMLVRSAPLCAHPRRRRILSLYSLTHSFTRSFTHSLTRPLTH
jgi:hypothetical protein